MTIDSVFLIETEAKVEKLNHMKLEVACSRRSKTNLNFQDVNKPYGISRREVLQS